MTEKTGKPKGRPALYSEILRPVSVTLDEASKAKAVAIGNGKLSAGVRIAVQAFNLSQVRVPAAAPETQDADSGAQRSPQPAQV